MPYKVALRDNETGEIRIHEEPVYDYDEHLWSEGNYSCDCNRFIFFNRAVGIEPRTRCECGATRYVCIYVEWPDGSRHEIGEDTASSALN